MIYNYDEDHYNVLKVRQNKLWKNSFTQRTYFSTDRAYSNHTKRRWWTWTYGSVIECGNKDHSHRSCRISTTKTGKIVTRNTRHIKQTSVTVEQYLRDQLTKSNRHNQRNSDMQTLQTNHTGKLIQYIYIKWQEEMIFTKAVYKLTTQMLAAKKNMQKQAMAKKGWFDIKQKLPKRYQ